MSNKLSLQTRLDYHFKDAAWLRQALTHPSYRAEKKRVAYDNQRLEFLGDAVLQLSLSDLLFQRHPQASEGQLSKMRSLLACEGGLARLARKLDMGPHIRLGRGDRKSGGHQRDSTLADAMEAVFGAIYLDGGFAAARRTIEHLYHEYLDDLEGLVIESNPKGRLQEVSQERFKVLPHYEVLTVSGPDHEPCFEVRVSVAGHLTAAAQAGNRREAEQEAARLALREIEGKTAGRAHKPSEPPAHTKV